MRVSSGHQSGAEILMSTPDSTAIDGTIEECVDELADFVATLDRFPQAVLALAIRIHLAGLLQALIEHGMCARDQVTDFIAELGREALQSHGDDA
jgi:hypothetical protein